MTGTGNGLKTEKVARDGNERNGKPGEMVMVAGQGK